MQTCESIAACVSCYGVSAEWMCVPAVVLVLFGKLIIHDRSTSQLNSKPHLTSKDRQNDLGAKDHQKGLEMDYPSTIPTISQEVRATWEGGGPCNVKRPIAWDGEGQSPERLKNLTSHQYLCSFSLETTTLMAASH